MGIKINELKSGAKRVELDATVIEIGKVREFDSKGSKGRVATATIQDESGTIELSLFNENIDTVTKGAKVHIENAFVSSYKGKLQVNVGKFGRLSVA
jgi:replication factor A1